MKTPIIVQAVVIVLMVSWSVVFAARRLLPASCRRAQEAFAERFDRPAVPRWLRRVAERARPSPVVDGGSGCSGCGGCGGAESKPAPQPLASAPRAKP